jgi:hypothetical protein
VDGAPLWRGGDILLRVGIFGPTLYLIGLMVRLMIREGRWMGPLCGEEEEGGHFWPFVVPNRVNGDADDKGGKWMGPLCGEEEVF